VAEFREQFFGGDELDAELLAYIGRLHRAYKTGIISNAMNGTRALIEGPWAMAPLFDAIVLSGEAGVMKPDPRIYQLALVRLEVQPEQAVFIDDFQHNIDGARAVGMHGIRFRSPVQVIAELEALLDGGGVQVV
jgi:epoxide hydrolase-like predicted phosphatase